MRTDDDCSSLTSGGSSNIDNNTSVLSGMERGGQEWEGNYSDGNSSSISSEDNVVNARRRTTSSVEVRRVSLSTRNVKGGSTASKSREGGGNGNGNASASTILRLARIDNVAAAFGLQKDRDKDQFSNDNMLTHSSLAPTMYTASARSESARSSMRNLAHGNEDEDDSDEEENGEDLKNAALAIANPLFGDTSRARGRQRGR